MIISISQTSHIAKGPKPAPKSVCLAAQCMDFVIIIYMASG